MAPLVKIKKRPIDLYIIKVQMHELPRVITKYVLSKIYTRQWIQGTRIPSKKAFSIKFNCSVALVMQALNHLKQNGFIVSVERKGYYVSENTRWYFFYSINEFFQFHKITSEVIADFKINKDIATLINHEVPAFKSFIASKNAAFLRKYYYVKDAEKISYFIFKKVIFEKFDKVFSIKDKPLYEFLASNGFIIIRNIKYAFFNNCSRVAPKNKSNRCWTVIEFIYDIDNQPVGILFVKYLDTGSSAVLYKREQGINY